MSKKPTYEELEQRIKELEQEAVERNRSEEALQGSEEKYRALVETTDTGYLILDEAGRVIDANPEYIRLTGHQTLEEIKNRSVVEWTALHDQARNAQEVEKCMKQGFVRNLEIDYVDRDGNITPIEINAKVVETEDELQILSLCRDITERTQAEEALRESEKRFRELTELLPISIYEMDGQGKLTFANRGAFDRFGYTQEDFIQGLNGFDMIAPEDRKKAMESIQRVTGGEQLGLQEYIALRKDGSTFPSLANSTTITRAGKHVGLRGFIIDVTKLKQAEEALRESESKFRSLFDLAPQAIALTEVETGKLIDVNNTLCKLTKYSKEEVVGKTTTEVGFYAYDQRDRFLKELRTSGEVNGLEMDFKAKDGTILTAFMFARIIQISGESFVMTIFLNITEQKQLQNQLHQAQRMEAIGTLAGGIAHDFNNLLMGIQGRTSLMMSDTDSSHPHNEHLKGIEDYVKNAAELTNQLLAFARGGKYEVRPTDLNILVKSQNRMFGRTKKEITIRGKYQENLWSAEVDQGQIEQVLLNLYVNAWQSMPGGGNLYIQTKNITLDENYPKPFEMKPGKYVKISVADTGVGMDEAVQRRIFDPFFTTKEMGRGTGLGLASVYGIIKNHGGFIDVYSEKGKGSTFSIYLPASDKKVLEEVKLPKDVLKGAETVLLVDDEKMIIDVGKPMLEKLGYNTLIARSGKDATEIYKSKKDQIDIVILDMIMPEMGGGDAYDRLKKINPEIKVLLSSGYSVDGQATEILERGCNGFIQKPFSMKDLSQKIREILGKK